MTPDSGHRLVRPWLPRTHPNFFVIYTFTLIFHVWTGALGLFGSDGNFAAPALSVANQIATHREWGIISMLIGIGLYLGLHCRTFGPARYVLSVGLAITALRFVCLMIAWAHHANVGYGPPLYFLAMGLHISQVKEPPVNPETAR